MERVTRFDPAEGLDTPEEVAAFWNAVLAENDPALTTHALMLIARARGLARSVDREPLDFEAVRSLLQAAGVRLHAEAA